MKEIKKFISIDNKQFDTEKECIDYEQKMLNYIGKSFFLKQCSLCQHQYLCNYLFEKKVYRTDLCDFTLKKLTKEIAEKTIHLVFDENEQLILHCPNKEIMWKEISEKIFDGAEVRLHPYAKLKLNPCIKENYIQYFDKNIKKWCTSKVYYKTIHYYECDE